MSEVISSFRSLITGSQVFALLMLILCVILLTMSSGKSPQLLCFFPFGMLCLSAISMMFMNILLAVCILVGMDFLRILGAPSVRSCCTLSRSAS